MEDQSENNCNCGSKRIDLEENLCFRIFTGRFCSYNKALEKQMEFIQLGYPSDIVKNSDCYELQTGRYYCLEEACEEELKLKQVGYNTYIIAV